MLNMIIRIIPRYMYHHLKIRLVEYTPKPPNDKVSTHTVLKHYNHVAPNIYCPLGLRRELWLSHFDVQQPDHPSVPFVRPETAVRWRPIPP
jgi:hypothetical protein